MEADIHHLRDIIILTLHLDSTLDIEKIAEKEECTEKEVYPQDHQEVIIETTIDHQEDHQEDLQEDPQEHIEV